MAIDKNIEKESPQISIIMPVYNVEDYLEKSLESVRNQTFKDWECIVVDDGSTDGSSVICDRYGKMDERFKVIHRNNGGVSKARNTGLDNARGEYIAFIDPDDWVEPDYLEVFYKLIKKYDTDVVQCGFSREFSTYKRDKPLTHKECVITKEEAAKLLLQPSGIPSLLWSKLYKKKIINEKFPEGHTYEDAYTMPAWFRNVEKVVLSPEITYHYRMRKGSITKIGMAKNHYDFIIACERLGNIVHSIIPGEFNEKKRDAYIKGIYIAGAKTIARKERNKELRREVILTISRNIRKINNPGIKYLGLKIWLREYLLRRYPLFFEKFMRGVNKLDLHGRHRASHLFD